MNHVQLRAAAQAGAAGRPGAAAPGRPATSGLGLALTAAAVGVATLAIRVALHGASAVVRDDPRLLQYLAP